MDRFVEVGATLGLACLTCLAACSSSSSGNANGGSGGGGNTFSGSLEGATVKVADGLFYANASSTLTTGTVENGLDIKLTDYASACAVQSANDSHKASSSYVKLELRGKDPAPGKPIAPGTYPVVSNSPDTGEYAQVEVKVLDATCNDTKSEATGGTVVVTSVTASAIQGTYDVTSANGHASGSFDVQSCAESATGNSTCQP